MADYLVPSLVLVLVGASHWVHVCCFPGGAPSGACGTLTPPVSQHLQPPQSTPVPFEVDLSNLISDGNGGFLYQPGMTYSCELLGWLQAILLV